MRAAPRLAPRREARVIVDTVFARAPPARSLPPPASPPPARRSRRRRRRRRIRRIRAVYYFNFATGESTWDHPCDEHYRTLYEKQKQRKLKENTSEKKKKEQDGIKVRGEPWRGARRGSVDRYLAREGVWSLGGLGSLGSLVAESWSRMASKAAMLQRAVV